MDIGEPAVDPIVAIGQALMINAGQREHRGMVVARADRLLDGLVRPFVRGAVALAAAEAAANEYL